MTHDSLCPLSEPCGKEAPEHRHYSGAATYPSMCIRCERRCQCNLIAEVRADERDKALTEWMGLVE